MSERDPRGAPLPVPRALALVSAAVLAAGVVMTVAGAWRVGVSFDEPYHVLRLQNYFDHGWYLLNDDLVEGSPGEWVHDAFVYSPVSALLMHLANVVLGHEAWGALSTTSEAYLVRHLGVAVIALIGVAGTAAVGRLVLRSWGWGLVCAATLVALPMWTGHSMFNIKDVPTATGYTLVTLALLWLLRTTPGGWRHRALVPLTMNLGVLLALGTRPGMWTGLLASIVGALLLARVLLGQGGRSYRWRWAELAAGVLPALLLVTALYPAVFLDPAWPLKSALSSGQYAVGGSSWYIPNQVIATMPLLLLMLGLAGLFAALADHGWRLMQGRTTTARLLLVVNQAWLLPTLAIVKQSHLDTGLRQVLFAAPAVAVMLVLAIRFALENAQRNPSRRPWHLVLAASCVALVAPTLVQATLFPLGYSYVSVIVDVRRLDPLNDSWRLSTRELAQAVPDDGSFVVCSPTVVNGNSMRYLGHAGRVPAERSRDCRTDDISPLTPYRSFDVDPLAAVGPTFIAVRTGPDLMGRNCTELADVQRTRHFRTVEMSAVARCELVLEPYPEGGVTFSALDGSNYLMGGWTGNRARPGVELLDQAGSFGFALDPELAAGALELTVRAEVAEGTVLRVNNVELAELSAADEQHRILVPAEVVAAMGRDRFVVTLVAPTPDGGVRLFEATVEEPG